MIHYPSIHAETIAELTPGYHVHVIQSAVSQGPVVN